jgi:membrane-associated phospholipid phosphatase
MIGDHLPGAQSRMPRVSPLEPTPILALLGIGFGLVVAAGATWTASRVYDEVTGNDGVEAFDRPILEAAKRFRNPAANALASGIAYLFGPVGMPVLACSFAVAIARRRRDPLVFVSIAAAGVGSLVMTVRDKRLVNRNRPPRSDAIPPFESSPSFPSGHTLNATTLAGVISYHLARRQSWPAHTLSGVGAVVVAGTVGLSRVLIGAHWFSDVAFGWMAGTAWATTVITVDQALRRGLRRRI